MTQRERQAPEGAASTASRPAAPRPVAPAGPALSPWEEWYQHASPAQRRDLLSVAAAQGVVFVHQLPAPPPANAAHGPSPFLEALLRGSPADFEPLHAPDVEPADASLDPVQRQAVAQAVHTPDVCLIAGYPGTGKSRVVAEVLRQCATRGERVLLLAPSGAALDRALERLPANEAVCPLRQLDADEKEEALPPCVRRFTVAARVRAFRDTTVPAARESAAAAEAALHARGRDAAVWDVLAELAERRQALAAEREELARQRRAAAAAVEAEVATAGSGCPAAIQTRWADCGKAREEAMARLEARSADLRAELEKIHVELPELECQRRWLADLTAARRARRWWTAAWWRAVLQGKLAERFGQVEQRCRELEDARARLTSEADFLAGERVRVEERTEEERRLLRDEEVARRQVELDGRLTIADERLGELDGRWASACRELSAGGGSAAGATPEGVRAAREAWEEQRRCDEQHLAFARQWAQTVEQALPTLAGRLAGWANVVAATTAAAPDAQATGNGSGPPFDVLVLEEADLVTESEFQSLARRARRWVLVGEPAQDEPAAVGRRPPPGKPARPAPLRVGFFDGLWRALHADPRRLPAAWELRDGRLVCRLRPIEPGQLAWVESERVADRPEVELRIVAPPRQAPYLAEVLFPGTTPMPGAKEFIYRELEELTVQARGTALHWAACDEHVVLELGRPAGSDAVAVPLCGGVCELVAEGRAAPGALAWQTCGLRFERAAGWDRDRAQAWVEEHLRLRDLGRTTLLGAPKRAQPALACFLADLLVHEGACRPAADGRGGPPPVEFVPVPALAREADTRRAGDRSPRWGGGGTATAAPRLRAVKGGAGLEVELAEPRRAEPLPAELRAVLPPRGVVNYLEAQAVVKALEALLADPEFQAACAGWGVRARCEAGPGGCEPVHGGGAGHGPVIAVMALFPSQVELIRQLVRRSPSLVSAPVEVGLPAAFRQRECLAALVSLTRSHTHRAVPFCAAGPEELARALTRPTARLTLFGDPGTLLRRSQWQGALDYLDEAAGRREQALAAALAGYIQGHGAHPHAFRLVESSGP
jgi:hypothetical protein